MNITKMARDAGFHVGDQFVAGASEANLERFAALVAAAAIKDAPDYKMGYADGVAVERKACAAICDRFQARDVGMQPAECAGAIRARGQK